MANRTKFAIFVYLACISMTSANALDTDEIFLECEKEAEPPVKASTAIYKLQGDSVFQWSAFTNKFYDVCKTEVVRLNCTSSVTASSANYAFTIRLKSNPRTIYFVHKVTISRYSGQYISTSFPLDDRDSHLARTGVGICAKISSPEVLERKF